MISILQFITLFMNLMNWKSGKKSIAMVKEGLGDVLMKGLISTDNLLKCMLDKENGVMLTQFITVSYFHCRDP